MFLSSMEDISLKKIINNVPSMILSLKLAFAILSS